MKDINNISKLYIRMERRLNQKHSMLVNQLGHHLTREVEEISARVTGDNDWKKESSYSRQVNFAYKI